MASSRSFLVLRTLPNISVRLQHHVTSGIEHANAMHEYGLKNKTEWKEYKVPDFFTNTTSSYYDVEVEMVKKRLPQPDPRVPDAPRDCKPLAEEKPKK